MKAVIKIRAKVKLKAKITGTINKTARRFFKKSIKKFYSNTDKLEEERERSNTLHTK